MLTIAVINQKGGVGKSTIATNLAAVAHLAGKRTLLVDLDSQGSALDWYHARAEGSKLTGLTSVKIDKPLGPAKFRELSAGHDVVVFDGPPRLMPLMRSAAVAADIIAIPVRPGPFDIWQMEKMLEMLAEADASRAEMGQAPARRYYVLTQAVLTTNLAQDAPGSLLDVPEELKPAPPVAPVIVQFRPSVYAEAAALGESVLTYAKPGAEAAAAEMKSLYSFLRRKAAA